MLNPKLKIGDRVRLLHMEGESIPPGTWGTVISEMNVFGSVDYGVDWDNGDKNNVGQKISQLNLISDCDAWDFGGKSKSINEVKKPLSEDRDMGIFIKNADVIKYFKTKDKNYLLDVVRFLKLIRKSGIVNMFGAAPFLYMGRDYIDRHYGDGMIGDHEAFEEVLDMADETRNIMIMVTMNLIEDKYKIDSEKLDDEEDEDSMEQSKILSLANRHIKDLANRVLQFYMISF